MDRIEKLVAERNELAAGIDYVRACLDDETIEDDAFDEGVTFCRGAAETLTDMDTRIGELEKIRELALDERNLVSTGTGPTVIVQRDNPDPFDVSDLNTRNVSDVRARALTAIEEVRHLPDAAREGATQVLERVQGDRYGEVAQRILLTGSDAYRSAFQKWMAHGSEIAWTSEERDAMARAASLTDNAGGFAIPFTLDSTVILTNDGAVNAIRDLARVVPIVTDTWNGVSSAGVTASYDAEAAEVSDDAPTLAQPSITTRMARAFVPFSIEIGGDWPNMEEEIRREIVDAKDRLETTVFWSGLAASNQPIGIETVTSTAGSLVTNAGETPVVGEIGDLYAATTERSRMSPSFAGIAEWSTLVEFRRLLAAAADRSSYNEATAMQPATLFGWPIREHSAVDAFSAVDTGATATSYLAVVGDWSKYVIADRVGMSMELVPHLFHTTTNLPSGQRGFFAYWRNGADSVDDNAFRVMVNVTSGA